VRRVKSRVEQYEGMLSRATSEPVEHIFANFAAQLLSHE